MSYPTIQLQDKKVILLSGYQMTKTGDRPVEVTDKPKLEDSIKKHGDAVAFTYYGGRWIPAA